MDKVISISVVLCIVFALALFITRPTNASGDWGIEANILKELEKQTKLIKEQNELIKNIARAKGIRVN